MSRHWDLTSAVASKYGWPRPALLSPHGGWSRAGAAPHFTPQGGAQRPTSWVEVDMRNTAGQTDGVTVKLGISLSDETHTAVAAAAKAEGLPLSTFVDRVLAREIFRRGVDDHNDMLREAGLADPDYLRTKIDARQQFLGEWKAAHRAEGGVE